MSEKQNKNDLSKQVKAASKIGTYSLSLISCLFMCVMGYEIIKEQPIQGNQIQSSSQPISLTENPYPQDEHHQNQIKYLTIQSKLQNEKIKALREELSDTSKRLHEVRVSALPGKAVAQKIGDLKKLIDLKENENKELANLSNEWERKYRETSNYIAQLEASLDQLKNSQQDLENRLIASLEKEKELKNTLEDKEINLQKNHDLLADLKEQKHRTLKKAKQDLLNIWQLSELENFLAITNSEQYKETSEALKNHLSKNKELEEQIFDMQSQFDIIKNDYQNKLDEIHRLKVQNKMASKQKVNEINELTASVDNYKKDIEELKEQLNIALSTKTELEEKNQKSITDTLTLEHELQNLKEQLEEYTAKYNISSEQESRLKEQVAKLQENVDILQKELENSQVLLAKVYEEKDSFKNQVTVLENTIAMHSQTSQDKEASLIEKEKNLNDLKNLLNETNEELNQLKNDYATLQNEHLDKKNALENFQHEWTDIAIREENLIKEKNTLFFDLDEKRLDLAKLTQDLEDKQYLINQEHEEVLKKQLAIENLNAEIQKQKNDWNEKLLTAEKKLKEQEELILSLQYDLTHKETIIKHNDDNAEKFHQTYEYVRNELVRKLENLQEELEKERSQKQEMQTELLRLESKLAYEHNLRMQLTEELDNQVLSINQKDIEQSKILNELVAELEAQKETLNDLEKINYSLNEQVFDHNKDIADRN
ncbi:chromosome segregation protein SMC [Candidatus Rubidus massiliensis]|nr:chromosome segregation protein SMC [Candidatus Rubidus massiliensis]